jgi:hypothetical protein
MSLRDYQHIVDWADATFPEQTLDGARAKFIEELTEFVPTLDETELPDVFITLVTYVAKLHGLAAFEDMVAGKMAINKARTWRYDAATGTGKHVKEAPNG